MSIYTKQKQGPSRTIKAGNGKRRIKFCGKRRYNAGGYFTATKVSDKNVITEFRHKGGKVSKSLKRAGFVNLLTGEGYQKTAILDVIESKDNRNFARLNILTKGTVINTGKGKAVVLNRPARDGTVNARIIE